MHLHLNGALPVSWLASHAAGLPVPKPRSLDKAKEKWRDLDHFRCVQVRSVLQSPSLMLLLVGFKRKRTHAI